MSKPSKVQFDASRSGYDGPKALHFKGKMAARFRRCRDPSRPSLSCRTSPPTRGRSTVSAPHSILRHWRLAKAGVTSNLPPSRQVGAGLCPSSICSFTDALPVVNKYELEARIWFRAALRLPYQAKQYDGSSCDCARSTPLQEFPRLTRRSHESRRFEFLSLKFVAS